MDLEELAKGISKEVENLKSLKKERSDLRERTRQTIDKNCRDIVLPVLGKYSDILQSIDSAVSDTGCDMPSFDDYYGKPLPCGLKMYISGVWVGFGRVASDIGWGRSSRSCGCTNIDYAPYWLSVENAQKSVNELTKYFCEYLQKCVDVLKVSSASVATEVQKLKDVLSASDTVQKNEDGTVEITFGGVKYRGTVVKD